MKCTRPRVVHDGNFSSEYPCGKCPACRRARTREWASRVVHEMGNHVNSCFLTLTYNDQYLPPELDKRALQLFLKRLRRDLEPRKIKYFGCGEYGERFKRPHYHLIIFGLSRSDPIFKFSGRVAGKDRYVLDAWPFGFIDIGDVNYRGAAYVAGYIQKKLSADKYGGRRPPFQVQSQGLGRSYVETNSTQLVENLGFTMNGAKCSLPRYYRKVLGSRITQDKLNARTEQRVDELDQFLEETGRRTVDDRMEYKAGIHALNELEIAQQDERKKGRAF